MYGYILSTEQPIEAYHRLHQTILDLTGPDDQRGLLVHIAYPTERGYDMIEVWESKDDLDAFNREVVGPAFQRLGIPMDGPPPGLTEFEPVDLLTPRSRTPSSL